MNPVMDGDRGGRSLVVENQVYKKGSHKRGGYRRKQKDSTL